ncbi:MAG: methyltransferase domain-containing protein [Nostocaceae cyanobacterium]|nr:methyltransferase domain-containing protein [Nostocaceae cyanobacterium]
MIQNQWNTELYENNHAFVWQNALAILELLAPKLGERILDLGCGTGQLTQEIANYGADVMGIDRDSAMIDKAKQNYPQLQFTVADATNFAVEPLDAVFSNAVLHWIPEADAVIRCVYQALKPNGRFVAEFGGKGNVKAIVNALNSVLETMPKSFPTITPWYFPSIAEYTSLLEKQGFDVSYAALLDRPTPLDGGDRGLANWMQMFASRFLEGLSSNQQTELTQAVEQQLKPILYRDGRWSADYRRIRIVATK